MRITRTIAMLLIAVLLVSSLIGCAPSQEDLDAAYETGHAEGYDAGYDEGYKVGYAEGYDAGYDEGYKVGYAEGKDAGYDEGYKVGYAEGKDAGYDEGYKVGYAEGKGTEVDELKVHFIDVGQGDSILIDLGDIEILIDGGGKSPGVVEYLSDFVDGALEVMVATHPHADHIGGLIGVLDTFEVDEVWLNGDTSTSQTYSQFMSAVRSEDAQKHEARRGDTIEVGNLVFNVLHPDNLSGTINNNSIVLSLSYGQVDFLFTGDAEREAEASMVNAGLISDVEVLKVGHHGSRTASSKQLLQATKPNIAIYMAGKGNSYGHPHQETISTLHEFGTEIYGTDVQGTIRVITDGKSLNVKPVPPIVTPTPAPAKFAVSNLSISPDDVEPGRTVTISATVTNSGGSPGNYTAILKINGNELETKSVVLDAGESQVIRFTVAKASTGDYTVELGGLVGTFAVTKAVTPPSTDTVYITRTGAKYHRGSCRYLRQSKIEIDRQEAIRRGYTPCSVCRP